MANKAVKNIFSSSSPSIDFVEDMPRTKRPMHTCLECEKVISGRKSLNEHLAIHTKQKPYRCPSCPKTFQNASNKRRHLRSHTGDKRYECEICEERFLHKIQWLAHKSKTHGDPEPYQCEECGERFLYKNAAIAHAKQDQVKKIASNYLSE